jgi:hypothetical protein
MFFCPSNVSVDADTTAGLLFPYISINYMLIPKSKTKCPTHSGEGINKWINSRIVFLDSRKIPHDVIAKVLQEETAHCDRDTTQDIQHSLETWGGTTGLRGTLQARKRPKEPRWPLDAVKRRVILAEHRGWGRQAWRDVNEWRGTEGGALLNAFGGPDRLVCLGATKEIFRTDRLGQFLRQERLETLQYIVPNPMQKISGRTKDGRWGSMHCDENVGRRWHIVAEFDTGTLDEQCALHRHLATLRELVMLVMLVYSGESRFTVGYDVYDLEEREAREFMREACSVGADYNLWKREQFTRCPDGTNRKTGERQELIYFKAV